MSISETAFLTNESRARRPDLSLDRWARSWIPADRRSAAADLWARYAEAVYPHDDLELGLRNRYYLHWLRRYRDAQPGGTVLLLAAGLVSYPYLIADGLRWIEVDLPELIDFKMRRADALVAAQTLPSRAVQRVASDLAEIDAQDRLLEALAGPLSEAPSCVLLEGVSYYLPPASLAHLLGRIAAIQPRGSLLAYDYWAPAVVAHPVFRRQATFFDREMAYAESDYGFLRHEDAACEGYEIAHRGSVADKAELLAPELEVPADEELLPEHSIVLVRS